MIKKLFRSMALVLLLATSLCAQPKSDLLSRVLQIAEPDQVQAFSQLNLSHEQERQLQDLARSYLPQIHKQKAAPGSMIGMMSGALTQVDAILTPQQRPLARKLLPRPHQWKELKRIYQEFN